MGGTSGSGAGVASLPGQGALAQLTLPQLMLQAAAMPGGREFLGKP